MAADFLVPCKLFCISLNSPLYLIPTLIMPNYRQARLYKAFSHVVRTLQGPLVFQDERLKKWPLQDRRMAIIGGYCVAHYVNNLGRDTQDVDIIVEMEHPVYQIRQALVDTDPDHFRLRADILYCCLGTDLVKMDIISHQTALPFHHRINAIPTRFPVGAKRIGDIDVNHPPFLSVQTMVALKVYCCGTRSTETKNIADASDAWKLASKLPEVVNWETWQRDAIQGGLGDVACFLQTTRDDWIEALHL